MDEERKKRGPEIQKKQKSDVEKKRNPKTLAKLKLGDNVLLYNGEKAVVKFIGSIHRKKGDFYGVELLDGLGKHDGSLNGKRYFKCPRNRGLFLRKDKIQKKIEPQPAPGRLNVEERRSHREKTKPLSKKADSPKPKRRRPSAVLNQKFTEQLVKGNSEKLEPTVKKKKVRKHNRSVSLLSQVNANAKRVKRNRTRSRNFSQTAVDLPGSNIMVGIRRKRKTPVNKEKLDEFFREAQLMQTREKQKAPDNKNQCPAIDLQIFQKYCAENGFNLGVNQFLLDLHSQSLDLEQGVNMSDFRAILSHYHNKSELEGRMMELFQVRGDAVSSPLATRPRPVSLPIVPTIPETPEAGEEPKQTLMPLKEMDFVKPPKTPPGEMDTPPVQPTSPKISEIDKRKHAISVNDVVRLKDGTGIIRFIGNVDFAKSVWFGIEVFPPESGDHDGIVDGRRYFECPARRGIFIKKKQIIKKVLSDGTELSARQLPVRANLHVHKRSKSKNQPIEEDPDLQAIDLVLSYILDEEILPKLFTFFDRKSRGVIANADIYYLVYIGILVFSRVKSGKKFRKPKMSSISKLVKNMTKHLVKKVFDGKTTLNLEDFGKYGDYLKREYSKLQKKMDSETSI